MWCPVCRNEYREGITECADCKVPLVEELPEEKELFAVAYIEEEQLAVKLIDYLGFSNIDAEYSYNAEKDNYEVCVKKNRLAEAKAAFRAFYTVETQNEINKMREELISYGEELCIDETIPGQIPDGELSTEDKERLLQRRTAEGVYKPAKVYVKKADESREMHSTAITFITFSGLLIVFFILNLTGVVTWFSGTLPLIVIGALAVCFALVGLDAVKRSRRAEDASVEEERLTEQLNEWLRENITEEFFAGIDDAEAGSEIRYLKRIEAIKDRIRGSVGEMDEDYLDSLIEEFYNSNFDME